MKTSDIIKCLKSLPPTSKLYSHAGPTGRIRGSEPEIFQARYAKAKHDPRFPWKFLQDFIANDLHLPPGICAAFPYLADAYNYIAHGYENEVMLEAMVLQSDSSDNLRHGVEAILTCNKVDMARIAEMMSIPLPVLSMYERLFFSVRDRLDDFTFYSKLVSPHTRYAEMQPGYFANAGVEAVMRYTISNSGEPELIKVILGLRPDTEVSTASQAMSVERDLFTAAKLKLHMGGAFDPRDHAVNVGRQLITSAKVGGGAPEVQEGSATLGGLSGLGMTAGPSPGESILMTIEGTMRGISEAPKAIDQK